jgi:hypothetical protein
MSEIMYKKLMLSLSKSIFYVMVQAGRLYMSLIKNNDGTTTWISSDNSTTITRDNTGKTIERTHQHGSYQTTYTYDNGNRTVDHKKNK